MTTATAKADDFTLFEQPLSRIVSRPEAPPEEPVDPAPRAMPAGDYRIIHGRVCVPRDPSEVWAEDGSRRLDSKGAYVPSLQYAGPGCIVWLNEEDATRMTAADLVEPVDAKPSRLGQVWQPPKPDRSPKVYTGANAIPAEVARSLYPTSTARPGR